MINIRIAKPEDAEQLVQLNLEFNGVLRDADQLYREMQQVYPTETVWVAEVDGKLAGFTCLQLFPTVCYDHPLAELTELYVREAFRGMGLGAGLTAAAEAKAKAAGCEMLLLFTGEDNRVAQRFYQQRGYKRMDECVFVKALYEVEG